MTRITLNGQEYAIDSDCNGRVPMVYEIRNKWYRVYGDDADRVLAASADADWQEYLNETASNDDFLAGTGRM